jgi:2-alkyl-3-oxoalkanoate reductase
MPGRYLITGATGFVGSHIAEACAGRGIPVSTLSRSGSDTSFLDHLGVTVHRGDLTDPEAVRRALEGADVVVHCAAKVGDWGPVEEYRAVNVEGLRGLLDACTGRPLHRFVHLSSLGVYAARHHHGTDESEPLPAEHMDGYTQTKVEAEHLVLKYHSEHRVPVVVLRPGFIYGPRDRTLIPRLADALKKGKLKLLGGGGLTLNSIYVGNLADAVFLAVERPEAVGQIYNLTDDTPMTKQRFIDAVADGFGLEKPRQVLPLWLANFVAWLLLNHPRLMKKLGAPRLTAAQRKFLLLNLDFSIEKAKRELGYRPRVSFEDGMRQTMAYFKAHA